MEMRHETQTLMASIVMMISSMVVLSTKILCVEMDSGQLCLLSGDTKRSLQDRVSSSPDTHEPETKEYRP